MRLDRLFVQSRGARRTTADLVVGRARRARAAAAAAAAAALKSRERVHETEARRVEDTVLGRRVALHLTSDWPACAGASIACAKTRRITRKSAIGLHASGGGRAFLAPLAPRRRG